MNNLDFFGKYDFIYLNKELDSICIEIKGEKYVAIIQRNIWSKSIPNDTYNHFYKYLAAWEESFQRKKCPEIWDWIKENGDEYFRDETDKNIHRCFVYKLYKLNSISNEEINEIIFSMHWNEKRLFFDEETNKKIRKFLIEEIDWTKIKLHRKGK